MNSPSVNYYTGIIGAFGASYNPTNVYRNTNTDILTVEFVDKSDSENNKKYEFTLF